MSKGPAVVVALALVACGQTGGSGGITVAPGTDFSQTASSIDRFIADGADPAAFANLANQLEIVRGVRERDVAADAELRLLALAAPLVDETRNASIDDQVDALALTVWPTLLVAPLTAIHAPTDATIAPATGESAAAYLLRLCSEPLSLECGGGSVAPAIAVRAIAIHRANLRMHQALGDCLHCEADGEPGWRATAYRWESMDRAMAVRQHDGFLDSDRFPTANLSAERGSRLARELR